MSEKILSVEERLSKYKFDNLGEFHNIFKGEDECRQYLALLRWGGNPKCPFCGHEKIYSLKNQKTGLFTSYKCANYPSCCKHFSIKVLTFIQDTKISLKNWLMLSYLWVRNKGELNTGIFEKGCHLSKVDTRFLVEEKLSWLYRFVGTELRSDFEVFQDGILNIFRLAEDNPKFKKAELEYSAGHMGDIDVFDGSNYYLLVRHARFRLRKCFHIYYVQDFITPEDVVAQFFISFYEEGRTVYDGGDIARGIWRAVDKLWVGYIKNNYRIRARHEEYIREYQLHFRRNGRKKLAHWYLMNLARARHSERTSEELKQQIDLLLNIKGGVAIKRSKKKEYEEPDFIRR